MSFEYKVGGSLPRNAPSYVIRPADDELYHALLGSNFCYILNSRQMGKSSLRVRTMQRLEEVGIACCAIDLTQIGSKQPTPDEWYSGIIRNLVRSFGLAKKVDLRTWLRERNYLSVVQKLAEFIEDVLLVEVSQQIVIFIDEIDSVISLDFSTDDFFALIRAFYNERADKPEYKRITFCLLGVANPSDLIKDIKRTPFNIGKAIALQGLAFENAFPLVEGLTGKIDNPQEAVKTVLSWTSGQPFLTQKVCQLILDDQEGLGIEKLIQTYIIDNWETQDNPEHLRTIRDRILKDEEQAVRSLGLYQQILNVKTKYFASKEEVNDTIELRISGLVVQQQGKLQPYNRIYQEVFNLEWVASALANLRPYAVNLSAWLASGSKDASLLLHGEELEEVLVWASTRNLSDDDYRYISESQKLDKQEAERVAQARLAAVKKQTRRQMIIGGIILGLSLLGSVGLGIYTEQERQRAFGAIQLEQDGAYAMQEFNYRQLPSLLTAMRTTQSLRKMLPQSYGIVDYPALSPVLSLQDILANIQEKNTLEGHSSPVSSVAMSSDGKIIASGSSDKTIKLWDGATGKLIRTLKGHSGSVSSVAISSNGKIIASGSHDKTIKLWDAANGTLFRTIPGHSNSVLSIAISGDGKTIASGSDDKTIKLWDVASGKLIRTIPGHSNSVLSVAISSNGKTIASKSLDQTIKLWDETTGKLIRTLSNEYTDYFSGVAISSDGKTIASGSIDNTIKLWDVASGTLVRTLEGESGSVSSIAISSNGETIASGSDDNTIKLWDVASGKLIHTLEGHSNSILGIAISRDGKTIASGSDDNTIKLWDAGSKKLIRTLEISSNIISIKYSTINSSSDDNTLKPWNTDSKKSIRTFEETSSFDVSNLITLSNDGKTIAEANGNNTIELWDAGSKKLIRTLSGHSGLVRSIAISSNRKTIASGSDDKTIKLWDVASGKLIRTFEENLSNIYSVAISSDGKTIAFNNNNNTIKLLNTASGKIIHTLEGHSSSILSLSISNDGKTIASGSDDKTIKLWDASSGKLIHTLEGHSSSITSVAISSDGKIIASGSLDKTIKLWNAASGKLIRTLEGHSNYVSSVVISSDSKTIVSGSYDKTIKLWNTDSGKLISTLSGNPNHVLRVAISSDGKTLVSANSDYTIKFWYFDINNLLVQGCNYLKEYLILHPNNLKDLQICQDKSTIMAAAPEMVRLAEASARKGNYKDAVAKLKIAKEWNSQLQINENKVKYLSLVFSGIEKANQGNLQAAINDFQQAQQLDAKVDLEPDTEKIQNNVEESAKKLTILGLISKGNSYLKQNNFNQAVTIYTDITKLQPTQKALAYSWNSLCWNGSLYGFAKNVLNDACSKAVSLAPNDSNIRDSRGLAKALTGDTKGAIADFEAFIKSSQNDYYKLERQSWVKELRAGKNPFTQEELEKLRQ